MLKKILTVMIAVAFATTSAFANSNAGLKAAFDELNYSLSVEWDQKDQVFYDAQMEKFSATLKALQAEGLSNAELIEFVKAELKDAKVAKDFEMAFEMVRTGRMMAPEAVNDMTETMKKAYSVGASWTGDIGGIIIMAVIVLILISVPQDSCYGSCE